MTVIQQILEKHLLQKRENRLGVYQLRRDEGLREFLYCSLEKLKELWMPVRRENYQLIYIQELSEQDTAESIYTAFNPPNRPDDFLGRSLTISDVIVLNRDSKITAYYIDANREGGVCFTELSGFVQSENNPRLLGVVMQGVPMCNDEKTPGYVLSDGTVLLDEYLVDNGEHYADGIGKDGLPTGFSYYPMILDGKAIAFTELSKEQEEV